MAIKEGAMKYLEPIVQIQNSNFFNEFFTKGENMRMNDEDMDFQTKEVDLGNLNQGEFGGDDAPMDFDMIGKKNIHRFTIKNLKK